jgi:hypothetical protein
MLIGRGAERSGELLLEPEHDNTRLLTRPTSFGGMINSATDTTCHTPEATEGRQPHGEALCIVVG